LDKYIGFEIDVNFNENKMFFNVSHDNIDGNEDLKYMLKDIKNLRQKYLWLDFKNLSTENKEKALNILNQIIKETNLIKEHIIVESRDVKSLGIFANDGYYTSFYLDCYNYNDYNNLNRDIELLEEKNVCVDFVSSDYQCLDIVQSYFPNINHLFWVAGTNEVKQKYKNLEILKDKNVFVILNEDTEYYY